MANSRQEYNYEILKVLKENIEKYPDYRFIQLLWALNIIDGSDKFYEESKETLSYIKDK